MIRLNLYSLLLCFLFFYVQSRKNDMDILFKLKGLQSELEKGKALLEAVEKREKTKRDYLLARRRIFDLRLRQREHEVQLQLLMGSSLLVES